MQPAVRQDLQCSPGDGNSLLSAVLRANDESMALTGTSS